MAGSEKKIRVLIAEDSAFMCRVLQTLISADAQMEVVGQAKDGHEVVAMAESLKPDVITMDINMPHMDGLEATELIMTRNPRPIVVVSSDSRDGASSTLQALELGAIDFVAKPSSRVDLDMHAVRDELCRKLKMAAKVRVVRTAGRAKLPGGSADHTHPQRASHASQPTKESAPAEKFPMVVMAASTGGPATLMRLVPNFPKDFPAAIFLVQHMPPAFTTQFSVQLAEIAALRVKEAEYNELAQPGTLYVCPGAKHLRVSATGRILLDGGERIAGYRPCADLALESVAAYVGAMAVAVVLTGMGGDAAQGVKLVKTAGGLVIAQDEATSVIFGMPAEAIKTGAVDRVLPLEEIYPAIEKRVMSFFSTARVGAR